ncbi:sigma-70 family RNA polymerase sigma factor [Streptomyces griseus]|uniref:sigma-70 family RNA polymerase sigma factor n=1 Tax=Streptomyces griseus TaxID=1911 RepID=UPI0033288545
MAGTTATPASASSPVLLTENPAAYAWTIMRNKVTDHARARTRRPPLIDEAAFNTVALRDAVDPIGQITESLALFRALRQLTDRQQDVMVMIYLQGMNATEAAAVLGMTSATVRSTVRHSLRRLRERRRPRPPQGHQGQLAPLQLTQHQTANPPAAGGRAPLGHRQRHACPHAPGRRSAWS